MQKKIVDYIDNIISYTILYNSIYVQIEYKKLLNNCIYISSYQL